MSPGPDQIENATPGPEEDISAEATGTATLFFWSLAVLAVLLVPFATREGRRDIGWFQEPATWPLIALCVAMIGGLIPILRLAALRHSPGFATRALAAFEGTTSSLIYGLTFLIYMLTISWLGFSLTTVLFLQLLFFMSGLRGTRWSGIALLIGLVIVAAFRVGLGIWFAQPWIAELFPVQFWALVGDYL